MRARIVCPLAAALLLASLVILSRPHQAWGAPEATCDAASVRRIKALNFDAMDENDRWELEKARQKLEDARLVAQNRGCLTDPELAITYVLLGVVSHRDRKEDAMHEAWRKALEIDPKVEIPTRVQTALLLRLFAAVKATAATKAPVQPARPGDPQPSGPPKGFEHLPILKWPEGSTLTISARVAEDLMAAKVSLFFRTDASTAGSRLELTPGGGDKWTWSVSIPGTQVRGQQLRYFLVAYSAQDREVAASGNSANMHIVPLTSAAAGAPKLRDRGMENPLDPDQPDPPVTRRQPEVPTGLEHTDQEDPRGRRTPEAGVVKTRKPRTATRPYFFASLGMGTGFGLMAGRTEVTNEAVPSAPSMGAIYGQIELGFLITRRFSLNAFARMGFLPISSAIKDADKGNDKDVQVLLRARYQSGPLLRAELPINLTWYAGGGLGWGIIRHMVNARLPSDGSRVIDTDRSAGFVPNVFGGVSMCVVRSCQIAVQLEVNYLATFTADTDLNTPFHMDFTLGAAFNF